MFLRGARWLIVLLACLVAGASLHANLDSILNYTPSSSTKSQDEAHEEAIKEIAANATIKEDKVLSQKELVSDLLKQLIAKYKPSGKLYIEPLQRWNDYGLPSSVWNTEIYSVPDILSEPRFAIGFKLFAGGKHIGSWRLPVIARHLQEAFISNRQINAGSRLDTIDFDKKELDSLRLRKSLLPTKNVPLDNFQAKRTISTDKPLFWDDVVARTLVKKGSYVQAIVQRGRMKVTMRVKSLEDGTLGDIIVLRNPDSEKRIEGKVIDEDKVLVYF